MFQPISFLRAFALVWAAVLGPPSVMLLVSAVTSQGLVFALGGLLLSIAPLLAWMKPHVSLLRRSAFAALVAWLLIAAWLIKMSPDGHPSSGARIENRYVGGTWHYQRHALGALLPEVDQFSLGYRLLPLLDPLLTYKQVRPLAEDTHAIYAELEADPDFHALGSVMPDAYNELWGMPFRHGHYFLHIPRTLDRTQPAPALVFLHGSGGNFKSYVWLLSRLADERNMVLIAPSYGFGNWDARHGPQTVAAALDDAAKSVNLDMDHVHLAGLSNGGLGVSRTAASSFGGRFCSLTFLSSVCDDRALASNAFATQWRSKPVLVITGEADDRVPLSYVKQCASVMRQAGAEVTMSPHAGADHFLFFSHRDQCLKELSAWLAKQDQTAPPQAAQK